MSGFEVLGSGGPASGLWPEDPGNWCRWPAQSTVTIQPSDPPPGNSCALTGNTGTATRNDSGSRRGIVDTGPPKPRARTGEHTHSTRTPSSEGAWFAGPALEDSSKSSTVVDEEKILPSFGAKDR